MWWSLELLEDGSLFMQETRQLFRHGAKGKVLLSHCLKFVGEQIINENLN
jgi:hypothetical protein